MAAPSLDLERMSGMSCIELKGCVILKFLNDLFYTVLFQEIKKEGLSWQQLECSSQDRRGWKSSVMASVPMGISMPKYVSKYISVSLRNKDLQKCGRCELQYSPP